MKQTEGTISTAQVGGAQFYYYGKRRAGESAALSQRPSDDVDKNSYFYSFPLV